MTALYSKSFIFGSYEREISCSRELESNQDDHGTNGDNGERLSVKTKSFLRTTLLGRNEQWCYFDYFQRKKECDGFTISKRALLPSESVPSRIIGDKAQVDQLYGMNASYLVDLLPNSKGLRVVLHVWFDLPELYTDHTRQNSATSSKSSSGSFLRSKSIKFEDSRKHKAQLRRLLAVANGITNLPNIIRRRRFGVQIPANTISMGGSNSRCPCCAHSLAPVKLSFVNAASAIATRSLARLKIDTRRCYLCGYLICINCWRADSLESATGRVASIIVCTRCNANVQACEYSEVFAGTAAERERHRGPPRITDDSNNNSRSSLLVDFLTISLSNSTAGSAEHVAAIAVIRALLVQEDPDGCPADDDINAGNDANDLPDFKETEAFLAKRATKSGGADHTWPE
ncbi:unnamed protein product [Phytophthora fragariaefolia]|uniref:Unnamed protein product n=1 Tax=Phytophthora fragariaefolia TaxID=1490495 RepID=A0A9W6TUZ2_9STRA|nr:unnamed protein product [Phytophthora fragariaefolia]